MQVWTTVILGVLAAASMILAIRRRRYVLPPTTRNKALAIAWITTNWALAIFLLLSRPSGWTSFAEIALAANMVWPWFLLSRKEENGMGDGKGVGNQ